MRRSLPIVFILSVCSLLSYQCVETPSEPLTPEWDIDLTIPIINRSWTLLDILTSTPQLSEDSLLGTLVYEDFLSPDPVGIGDEFKVTASPTQASATIPAFEISTPAPLTVGVDIPGLPPGPVPVVPSFDVTIPTTIPPIAEFQEVFFESGDVTVTIENRLPVPIEFPDPITLRNSDDASVAVQVSFAGQFQPNETRSTSAGLAGRRWINMLTMDLRVTSTGSATPVTIPDTAIVTTVAMSNVKVTSATAQIPQQSIVSQKDTTFQIDDSTRVNFAEFTGGMAQIIMKNNVDVDVGIFIQMNELIDKAAGQPFVINTVLPRRGPGPGVDSTVIPIDFANFRIDTTMVTGTASFRLGLTTLGSAADFRMISEGDSVVARFEVNEPLFLSTLNGILRPTGVTVDENVQIEFGDLLDTTRFQADFTFDDVVLEIALTNETGFAADANLRLVGSRAGKQDSLLIPTGQERINRDATNTIRFDETNSRIIDFMNSFVPNLPDQFILRGNLVVNPIDVYQSQIAGMIPPSSVSITDSLTSSVRLFFPLKIGVSAGIFSEKVAIGEGETGGTSSEDIDTALVDLINSGSVTFQITNGFPISLQLATSFLDVANSQLFDLPKPTEPAIQVSSGSVDSQGRVTAPALSTVVVTLDRDDIDKFVNQAEVIDMTIDFTTSGGGSTPVLFRTNDAVSVRAHASLSARIDPDSPATSKEGGPAPVIGIRKEAQD